MDGSVGGRPSPSYNLVEIGSGKQPVEWSGVMANHVTIDPQSNWVSMRTKRVNNPNIADGCHVNKNAMSLTPVPMADEVVMVDVLSDTADGQIRLTDQALRFAKPLTGKLTIIETADPRPFCLERVRDHLDETCITELLSPGDEDFHEIWARRLSRPVRAGAAILRVTPF